MGSIAGRGSGQMIRLMVADEVKNWYEQQAREAGVPLSDYVRPLLLAHKRAKEAAVRVSATPDFAAAADTEELADEEAAVVES